MEVTMWMALATTIFTTMVAVPSLAANTVTFVFGDSLTDVGNNNYLQYSLAKSNYPWYGVDYVGGRPTGRFSNGRTIGDLISEKLGIPSPPPYLSLSRNNDALLKGVNYASGGAGILNSTGLYFIQRLSFDDQIQNFKKTTEVIKAKIGAQAAAKLFKEAIFFLGLGSNDYINNYLQPFLPTGRQYTPEQFVELLMRTLEGQLKTLYHLGARNMTFHGLGPLGCIPSQRVRSNTGQCLNQVNNMMLQFNSNVEKLLASLDRQLPGAKISFADTYGDVLDLIQNPTAYGFKVSNLPCCNVATNIGGLCLPNSQLCSNRREYVFWDAFHPTDAANAALADKLFKKLFTPPSGASTLFTAPSGAPAPSP
ncbi:GDSL esterase/lipase At5g37690-like [Pyrus communis]|uniref:GDSL esterase/lipase At5g37690-like n=1 Tax=Pyrus communis TaxID=23211 RepID=UPI0035BFD31E